MAIMNLVENNFEETIGKGGIVLVDAWAPWCGPCRAFAPVFEKAAERHPKHVFAKLNTENESKLRNRLEIEHIPTLMVFRDGLLLYKQAGSPPDHVLDEIVAQAETLDMDEVRKRHEHDSQRTAMMA